MREEAMCKWTDRQQNTFPSAGLKEAPGHQETKHMSETRVGEKRKEFH